MKSLLSLVLIIVLGLTATAQNEDQNTNVVKVKKIRVENGDTTITEKVYTQEAKVKITTSKDDVDVEKLKIEIMDEIEDMKLYMIDSLAGEIVNMKIDIDFDFKDLLEQMDLSIDTVMHEHGKKIIIKSTIDNKEHIHFDNEGNQHKIVIITDGKKGSKDVVLKNMEEEAVWVDDSLGSVKVLVADSAEIIHVKKHLEAKKAKRSIFVSKVDDKKNEYHLMVYPSAAKTGVYIEFDPQGKEAELKIENANKEVVHQEVVKISKGAYSRKINLSEMKNGTYFVHLIIEGEKYTRKVIAK